MNMMFDTGGGSIAVMCIVGLLDVMHRLAGR